MAKAYYLPTIDKEKLMWLRNFNMKCPVYGALFGFSAAEITSLANDTTAFGYHLDVLEVFKTETRERTSYKDSLRDGPIGTPLGGLPGMPGLPAPPPVVASGIFPRVASMVKRIKAHPAYTDSIGQDLGIIGAEPVMDLITQRPVLTLVKGTNCVIVKYVRGENDGIQLYSRRGGEQEYSLLSGVNLSSYRDKRPNLVHGQPEIRQYKALFILNDEEVGQESNEASIVV